MNYFHLAGERSFSYDEFRMTLDSELYYYRKNNLDEIECLEKRISLFEFVYFFNRIRLKNQINLNFYKAVHECKRRIDSKLLSATSLRLKIINRIGMLYITYRFFISSIRRLHS